MKKGVTFQSNGLDVKGDLYIPDDYQAGQKLPAIVVGHPFGGVKEQTAGLYTQKLCMKGNVTLAFDASYQGESAGEPRFLEDPWARCSATGSAATATRSCATGCWRRPRRTAPTRRTASRPGWSTSSPTPRPRSPRTPRRCTPRAPTTTARPRAQHPNSKNRYVVAGIDRIMAYHSYDHVDLISPRPLLMIAGTKADTKYFSEQAYAQAKEPKELYLIDGATHIDLYDKPEYVTPAVERLDAFFDKYLAPA